MATDIVVPTAGGTPQEIAKALHETAKTHYWKQKDLAASKAILIRGIAYAKEQASSSEDEAARNDLLGAAKAMCFDLASFCWPGWGEEGIDISEDDLTVGEEAADENLRLAIDLRRAEIPMSNAHFMVGAYHLSRRRFPDARTSFEAFREFAEKGGDANAALLAEGYLALARLLEGEPEAAAILEDIEHRFRQQGTEDGPFYADQLATARTVLTQV